MSQMDKTIDSNLKSVQKKTELELLEEQLLTAKGDDLIIVKRAIERIHRQEKEREFSLMNNFGLKLPLGAKIQDVPLENRKAYSAKVAADGQFVQKSANPDMPNFDPVQGVSFDKEYTLPINNQYA